MNANELADKLEKPMVDNPDCPNFSRTRGFMEQVVAMLRQQQAKLKKSQELLREYTALNMRQQAEIEALKNRNWDLVSEPWGFDRHLAKTLTNNEIEVLWEKHCPFDLTAGIKFARAILRKAQEK